MANLSRGFYSAARHRAPCLSGPCDTRIPEFPAELNKLHFLQFRNVATLRSLVYDASAQMDFGYKQAHRRRWRRRLIPDRVFYSATRPRPAMSFGAMRYAYSGVPRRNNTQKLYKFKRGRI